MAITVENDNQFVELLKEKPCIIDFTASWCGPCKRIKPQFLQLATENPHLNFLIVDVDQNTNISQLFKVAAMPTFILAEMGEPGQVLQKGRFSGGNLTKLQEMISLTTSQEE